MLMYINILLNIFLTLILSGCGNDFCIDADDFGFARSVISARYPKDGNIVNEQNQVVNFQYIQQYMGQDVGAWLDSGYTLNGDPLTIVVRNWKYNKIRNNANGPSLSAWSPWFGGSAYYNTLPVYLYNLRSCQFHNNNTCLQGEPDNLRILNAPCLMTKGVGLFGAIMKQDFNNSKDPNQSPATMFNPKLVIPDAYTFHVGDLNNNAGLYDINNSYSLGNNADSSSSAAGGIVIGCGSDRSSCSSSIDIKEYANGKLYFKILDSDYSDNAGQYIAMIKSGVKNLGFDPFRSLSEEFKVMIFGGYSHIQNQNIPGIVPGIYNNILSNNGYLQAVQALLILNIIFVAIGFLIGVVKFTQAEFFSFVFRIILISILINTKISWDFFNQYLFSGFIGGLDQIIQLVEQAATGGQEQGPESVIALIFSEQTFAKLSSLLLLDLSGWAYFIIFMIMTGFIVIMYLQAYVLSVTASLMIGIIISLAPIFLCFMLFGMTRYLYENWLQKLVVYSFQTIILFASLAFLGSMVRDEIYSSLGFKVCKFPIIDLGITAEPLLSMYYPQPQTSASFRSSLQTDNLANIAVPKPKTTYDSATNTTTFQAAYTYKEDRYLDLPFLDPNDPADQIKLNNFRQNGLTVNFGGLFELILLTLLLYKFNASTIGIANTLIGNSSGGNALRGVGKSVNSAAQYYRKSFNKAVSEQLSKYSAVKFVSAVYNNAKARISYIKNEYNNLSVFNTSWLLPLINDDTKRKFFARSPFLAQRFGITDDLIKKQDYEEKREELSFQYHLSNMEMQKISTENAQAVKNYINKSAAFYLDGYKSMKQQISTNYTNMKESINTGLAKTRADFNQMWQANSENTENESEDKPAKKTLSQKFESLKGKLADATGVTAGKKLWSKTESLRADIAKGDYEALALRIDRGIQKSVKNTINKLNQKGADITERINQKVQSIADKLQDPAYLDKAMTNFDEYVTRVWQNNKAYIYNGGISILQYLIDQDIAKYVNEENKRSQKQDQLTLDQKQRLETLRQWDQDMAKIQQDYQAGMEKLQKEPNSLTPEQIDRLKQQRAESFEQLYKKYNPEQINKEKNDKNQSIERSKSEQGIKNELSDASADNLELQQQMLQENISKVSEGLGQNLSFIRKKLKTRLIERFMKLKK